MTRILIVDEDTDVLRLLRIKLTNAGYEVLRARDSREALQIVAGQQPEVVLTELVLSDCDGMEFLEQLSLAAASPLVLALSSRNSDDAIAAALAAGADDYLSKPFSPQALLERLRVNLLRGGLAVPRRTEG
jgi:two-component system KDP operon response regulator KdpE